MRRAAAFAFALLAIPRAASATWSITAVDPRTREVGIAGASCTPNVLGIAGVVPGRGVIAAQALTNGAARQRGMEMLRAGASPMEIVRAVTDSVFDPVHVFQQYGVAALGHAPAAYTGAETDGWHGHEVDADVSVQGNLLVGPRVVGDAMAAFRAAAADTSMRLADRLLLALEAGAAAGGDARCPGQTALSAFLIVAGSGDRRDAQHLRLYVNGQLEGGANPVALLRQRYDEWRRLIRSHVADGGGAGELAREHSLSRTLFSDIVLFLARLDRFLREAGMNTWKLEDAKNRFSEVVRRAMAHQPQLVTRNGRKAVVIMSADDYDRIAEPRPLLEFMQASPLTELIAEGEFKLERSDEEARDIEF